MRDAKGSHPDVAKWDRIRKTANWALPIAGAGLMAFYELCDTSCTYLQGAFLGIDLKYIGIFFMAALLALNLPAFSRWGTAAGRLRTMMLAGAVGGEAVLLRFQAVNDTYCPFCLAFGLTVTLLFIVNFPFMNRLLALGSFLAGGGAFALFFTGSVLPLY